MLFIAAKMEEVMLPDVGYFSLVTGGVATPHLICLMERRVL
jgi:hypothetical protein